MTSHTLLVEGMHCQACVKRLTQALSGVSDAVSVSLDPPRAIIQSKVLDLTSWQEAASLAGKYRLSFAQDADPEAPGATTAAPIATPTNPGLAAWFQTYQLLLLVLAMVSLVAALLQVRGSAPWQAQEFMLDFMAGFFLAFAFSKLLNLKAFAQAYASDDLLAQRWMTWGLLNPFVELGLGLAYLARWQLPIVHWRPWY